MIYYEPGIDEFESQYYWGPGYYEPPAPEDVPVLDMSGLEDFTDSWGDVYSSDGTYLGNDWSGGDGTPSLDASGLGAIDESPPVLDASGLDNRVDGFGDVYSSDGTYLGNDWSGGDGTPVLDFSGVAALLASAPAEQTPAPPASQYPVNLQSNSPGELPGPIASQLSETANAATTNQPNPMDYPDDWFYQDPYYDNPPPADDVPVLDMSGLDNFTDSFGDVYSSDGTYLGNNWSGADGTPVLDFSGLTGYEVDGSYYDAGGNLLLDASGIQPYVGEDGKVYAYDGSLLLDASGLDPYTDAAGNVYASDGTKIFDVTVPPAYSGPGETTYAVPNRATGSGMPGGGAAPGGFPSGGGSSSSSQPKSGQQNEAGLATTLGSLLGGLFGATTALNSSQKKTTSIGTPPGVTGTAVSPTRNAGGVTSPGLGGSSGGAAAGRTVPATTPTAGLTTNQTILAAVGILAAAKILS